MSTKNIWLIGFFLSFLSFAAAIAFKLGWFQSLSYNHYRNAKLQGEFISELKEQQIPEFQIYTQSNDTLGIFEFIQNAKALLLFLGPGCAPCDDGTIDILAKFERTKAHQAGLDVIALVFRYNNEFMHLRKLTTYNFQGMTAKFSSLDGYDIPRYPALYLVEKNSRKVLDAHFPRAEAENQLEVFLNGSIKLNHLRSSLSVYTGKYVNTVRKNELSQEPEIVAASITNLSKNKQAKKLIFQKRFPLEYSTKDNLISQIKTFAVGKNGEIYMGYDRGSKLSIFNQNGGHIQTITEEDVFGPGARSTRSCRRILPLDETKVGLLYFGFVNDLVIYDWKSKKFDFIQLKDKNDRRVHPVVDVAMASDRIYLLTHPQRTLGYFSGLPEIIELDFKGAKQNSFAAFPDLEFPNLSQQFALNYDQIVLSESNLLYASNPLGDRIYRFDLSGKRLEDLVYPEDYVDQLDSDAPGDPRTWPKYFPRFMGTDLINEIFCLRKNGADNIVAIRQKGGSLYFDLFDENGVLTALGKYTMKDFEDGKVASSGNLFYGYKWPDVDNDQFLAYGNPEIVVYRLD